MEIDAGDLDHDYSLEELFIFRESVSTLQSISSHAVSLQLWYHYLGRAKIQEETYDFFLTVFNLDEDYEREKLAKLLKTPQRIEEMLNESLKNICNETVWWINYFNDKIFRDGMSRYCVRNFDPYHIVWRPNGEIDCKRSVSKMLTEGKLNVEQKFVLMCSCGMATELERFPANSLPEFFCLLAISDLKVAYWISYHRHDLREIWLKMPGVIRPEDTSINVNMAMKTVNLSLPYAFEHFWSRLNEDEQISVAVRILPRSRRSRECQRLMLSTMSSFQRLQVFNQIPVELMTNFSNEYRMPEYVFIVWTVVKDWITEQQFVQFLENVLSHEVLYSEKYMIMFIRIWDTASDHLKRHIVENCTSILFASFMQCHTCSPSGYKFFMKFLPLVNEPTRKELYLALKVCDIYSKCDIDILNLCLPGKADQLQLKNRIMESREMVAHCALLLNHQNFDEVIAKVTFFSRNDHDTREFFSKALESSYIYDISIILENESWIKLSNFIDTVFTNDFPTISRLKKHIVSSLCARDLDCWDKNENVDALVQITEQVFSTEDLKLFKQTLLKNFQKVISSQTSWRDFEGKCYNTFVSWCSDDENQIVDFKSIVPIDAFFDEIFRTICSLPNNDPGKLLNELDAFLKYVCVSDEEVELVKIRKYIERDGYWIRQIEQFFMRGTQRTILNWLLSVRN